MTEARRMDWVDVAKALSIILVVMMYAAYNVGEHTGGIGYLHYVIGFATPFRMPEFFLISGLFLSQVIARPWLRYADRRVLHYSYFYALWAAIMIALKVGLYSGAPLDALDDLALALVHPYGVLWFVYLLAVFGLAAKLLWQASVPHWAVLTVAAALQMAHLDFGIYVATQFAAYFVFFYVGYAASPLVFGLVAAAERRVPIAAAALAAWALVNGLLVFSDGYAVTATGMKMGAWASLAPIQLALAMAGTLALCIASALLSKLPFFDWLRWLGEHSLIVYLAFTIPMSIFRGLAVWSGLLIEPGLLSTAVLIVSLAAPVFVYLMIQHFGIGHFLFERPRWARLPTGSASPRPIHVAPMHPTV